MIELVTGFFTNFTYWGMFFLLVVTGAGVPIPEEIMLVACGVIVYLGIVHFWPTVIVAFFGAVLGDMVTFYIARSGFRTSFARSLYRRALTPRRMAKFRRFFHRVGWKAIFLARFVTVLRIVGFITAGMSSIKWWKFLLLDAAATAINVLALVFIGWYFGENINNAFAYANTFTGCIALICGLGVVLMVLLAIRWKRKKKIHRKELATIEPTSDASPAPSVECQSPPLEHR